MDAQIKKLGDSDTIRIEKRSTKSMAPQKNTRPNETERERYEEIDIC